jgi:hypothetical protein
MQSAEQIRWLTEDCAKAAIFIAKNNPGGR